MFITNNTLKVTVFQVSITHRFFELRILLETSSNFNHHLYTSNLIFNIRVISKTKLPISFIKNN